MTTCSLLAQGQVHHPHSCVRDRDSPSPSSSHHLSSAPPSLPVRSTFRCVSSPPISLFPLHCHGPDHSSQYLKATLSLDRRLLSCVMPQVSSCPCLIEPSGRQRVSSLLPALLSWNEIPEKQSQMDPQDDGTLLKGHRELALK